MRSILRLAPPRFGAPLTVALLALAACGSDGAVSPRVTGGGPVVASVTLTPRTLLLAPGQSAPLTAEAFDTKGSPIAGKSFSYSSSNPAAATVSTAGVVTGVAAGTTTITATTDGVGGTMSVAVAAAGAGTNVFIDASVGYQTIVAWEGGSQLGQDGCNSTAFSVAQPQVLDRLVNELGINGVGLGVHSGMENPVDYDAAWLAGTSPYKNGEDALYYAINDNANPFSADPNGFHWSKLDRAIDLVDNPLRQRLAARGERLYVRLIFGDMLRDKTPQPFRMMSQPEEYAEFITEAFKHIRAKYGWSPDALELLNEPDVSTRYDGTMMGRALVTTAARLAANGFHPDFIGPGTTSVSNASVYYDAIVAVPGARQYVTDLSYHRYRDVSDPAIQQIALRRQRDGVRTGMLEHIGSGIDDLWTDLTVANVSSWSQFALAGCSNVDNPNSGGTYYQVNQSVPSSPQINFTTRARQLRQVFAYVRSGAVRIGATTSAPGTVDAMAFRNANGKLVTVVYARSARSSFTVQGLTPGAYGITYATGSAWNVALADATVSSAGTLSTSIPAPGVLTIFAR